MSIHRSILKPSYLSNFLNPIEISVGRTYVKIIGLTISNTDPNIPESISRVNKLYKGSDKMKRFALKKKIPDVYREKTLSPKEKKAVNIIKMNTIDQHTITKSHSCTNNKLPLLKINTKTNVLTPPKKNSPQANVSINTKAIDNKTIKPGFFSQSKRVNFELLEMNRAITSMLKANKKRNKVLKTFREKKWNLQSLGTDNKKLIDLHNKLHKNHHTDTIIPNITKVNSEEEDSFDMPEEERQMTEIYLDSLPSSIKYPRIVTSPPFLTDNTISSSKKYNNLSPSLPCRISKIRYKHEILQTEPLGIIKEEDEQSDLTKTHSSAFKKKSTLLSESNSNAYLLSKPVNQTNGFDEVQLPFHTEANREKYH